MHPGHRGQPRWRGEDLGGYVLALRSRRLATLRGVAGAVVFLLRNGSVSGVNLNVDGGWLLT